ncbi:MAG: HAD-IIIA family hydrolase [Candidatus Riflebacteria bacterium]|nr:HAD-IIIA family hydrolase [Candidatus Riflebacteria bacterium]
MYNKNHIFQLFLFSILLFAVYFQSCPLLSAPPSIPTAQIPQNRQIITPAFSKPAAGTKIKVAFFDADSTLRVSISGAVCPNGANDVAILPLVANGIATLNQKGFLVAIVSNQLGVSTGHLTFADAEAGLRETCLQIGKHGGLVHYFDFAEANDDNRKPKTGMATRLSKMIEDKLQCQIDWENSYMVGDSGYKKGSDTTPDGHPGEDIASTDRLFAEAVAAQHPGFVYIHPRDFFGWTKYGVRNFENYQALQAFYKAHPELQDN